MDPPPPDARRPPGPPAANDQGLTNRGPCLAVFRGFGRQVEPGVSEPAAIPRGFPRVWAAGWIGSGEGWVGQAGLATGQSERAGRPSMLSELRVAQYSARPSSPRRSAHSMRVGRSSRYSMNGIRSEEHTSELQSLMRISYAVFCLKKKKTIVRIQPTH